MTQIKCQELQESRTLREEQGEEFCTVPFEYVLDIIEIMSIDDAVMAVEGMLASGTGDRERAMKIRCNPVRFLRDIFQYPEKLLDLMRCTGTIIWDKNAIEYFNISTRLSGSTCHFYCPSEFRTVAMFTYHLNKMGVSWYSWEDSERDSPDAVSMGFHVLRGSLENDNQTIDIRCLWSHHQHYAATSSILSSNFALTPCFISGFAAVSVYNKHESFNQATNWMNQDASVSDYGGGRKCNSQRQLQFSQRKESNESGHSDEVCSHPTYDRLEEGQTGKSSLLNYLFKDNVTTRGGVGCHTEGFRSIGDTGCWKVSFKEYIDHSKWEIPFDVYYRALDLVFWSDTGDKIMPAGEASEVDFPCKWKYHFHKYRCRSDQLFDPMVTSFRDDMIQNSQKVQVKRWPGQILKGVNPAPWLGVDFNEEDFCRFTCAYQRPC
ncbi:hypothetical protein F5884DRAFT_863708 [Xylogone sp. PMI_703]|nr:hypothetical protein F5884DRAFT_863708 [Xylogone sp. PMI_703]